ncbi:SDR family oxidoreductase [Albimonas sp. CAU 1670]|uniref:SDR family NAD(P)-dependent oxidoreductase n=1 Tax=Albimonas sp. CAU 1670 TaxID=3032599 RepID=UPI0023DAC6F0|nr:SDR family oxidoreductase [Albimonas sp. CAU 1670]MDF2233738.1 SDR family oxidoreductase [Albimonas sp. CAU 1670]
MRMKNRAGIVTAAASGMGRAGAEMFAAEGAAVAVVDRDEAAAQEVVAGIEAAGGRAVAISADLRDVAAAKAIVAQAEEALGRIDFLWNHLGHPGPGKVEGMAQEDLSLAFDLNLRSVMATTEAAIPRIRAAGGGSILYTSSTAGLIGSRYSPVYSAMKHGVIGFAKALALRLADDNIRVNVVCPGPVMTPMFHTFGSRPDAAQKTLEEVTEATLGVVPLKRVAEPREIAAAALFLLSDEASFVTGAALPVDGGITAR